MKKISVVILFTIFLSVSCMDKNPPNVVNVAINVDSLKSLCRIDSVPTVIDLTLDFKEIDLHKMPQLYDARYVELESEGGYIARVRKMEIFDNRIYIWDSEFHVVFIYDFDGKLIKKINSKGRGSNEYLAIGDMTFTSDMLIISDRMAPQVLYFTLDGEFVRKEKYNLQTIAMQAINDSVFLNVTDLHQNVSSPINGKHLVASIGDSVIACGFDFFPIQKDPTIPRPMMNNFRDINGKMRLFRPNLSDTIYYINDNFTYYPKYLFECKNSYWQYKNRSGKEAPSEKSIHTDYNFFSSSFFDGKERLLFATVKGNSIKSLLYNLKDKNKSLIFSYTPPLMLDNMYKNEYVSYTSPDNIMDLYAKYKLGEIEIKDKELIDVISKINEDSNGIITFLTLNIED